MEQFESLLFILSFKKCIFIFIKRKEIKYQRFPFIYVYKSNYINLRNN
jgi:hypothetical protein